MASTAVREKPIIFSGDMVSAILDGRKTMTRRIVKPQPEYFDREPHWRWSAPRHKKYNVGPFAVADGDNPSIFGDYVVGDLLWVRETWAPIHDTGIRYRADNGRRDWPPSWEHREQLDRWWQKFQPPRAHDVWASPIHMPRWASRLTLEIIGVRVERLHSISEGDAIAEGIEYTGDRIQDGKRCSGAVSVQGAFEHLWDSIHGKSYPWKSNPWVWCISFRRVEESNA